MFCTHHIKTHTQLNYTYFIVNNDNLAQQLLRVIFANCFVPEKLPIVINICDWQEEKAPDKENVDKKDDKAPGESFVILVIIL